MKYKSKDKTVEKALNKTWVLIGIPFFTTMIATFIFGFYILDKYKMMVGATPLIVIVLGIAIPGIICHNISKVWFSYQIDKVEDKLEFYERAVRKQMIWESSADKIIQKKGIVLNYNRIGEFENLPEIVINENLILTSEKLILNNESYLWTRIKDFRLLTVGVSSIPKTQLIVRFDDNTSIMKIIKLDNSQDTEFLIDKYLNNCRKKYEP